MQSVRISGRLTPQASPFFVFRYGGHGAMNYSYRKTLIGSTRDARRAGM